MKYLFTATLTILVHVCFAQDTWTTRQNFAGADRFLSTGFAIGTKVYVGTGLDDSFAPLADMWAYDVNTNAWTPKNSFEGAARVGAISFTINGKGYLGLGGTLAGAAFTDLWEYDAITDDWTKKADLPATGRSGSSVFVVNNKAYIVAGQTPDSALSELWEYDPANNTWTQKTSLPSTQRLYASAFAIGSKGYFGLGLDAQDNYLKDFWEYNPSTDVWTKKADFPLEAGASIGFATTTRGYMGLGESNQLWSYYPNADGWVQEEDLPALSLLNSTCVFVNGKAYIANGFPTDNTFYEYTVASDQSITFNTLSAKTFGDAAFTVSATSTASLPVSFTSSNTAVATVNVNTITIVGAGTTIIKASQGGNATFDAAVPVERTLTVGKAGQTITFNALAGKNVNAAPFALTATTTSGLPIAYSSSNTSVATVSGNTVTIVGAGTTTITASQAGNNNYNVATPVPQDLVVSKLTQTITFGTLSPKTTSDVPFNLTATASSSLTVSYSSSNTSVATVSGNTVTLVGAGTTTITASQPGNATYAAAASVDQSLSVSKGAQSWVGSLPTTGGYGNNITITAHLSTNLPYSLTSSNTSIATVALVGGSWVVTPVGIGNTTLTASHPGNAQFDAPPNLTSTLVISKGTQTITMADIPVLKIGVDTRIVMVPRASSGLPVTIETNATSNEVLVYGNALIPYTAFSGTVTLKQAGNDFYLPAQLTKSITVQRGTWTLAMDPFPEMTVGVAPFRPAIAVDRSDVGLTSGNPAVATIVGGKVNIVGPGTATIFAIKSQDAQYNSASVSQVLTVKTAHTITFDPISDKLITDAPFNLSATASSGLPVTFASSDPAIATVSGNTVTIVGAGSAMLTASAGNGTYAMTSSSQVLNVKIGNQTPSQQGQLWGIQTYGGAHASGLVFKTNGDGTDAAIVKEFKASIDKGFGPSGTFFLAPNGKFYGATSRGGLYNGGTIYEFDAANSKFTKKIDLKYADYPVRNWVIAPNGKIYGAKSGSEGDEPGPVVFEFDTQTGQFAKVKSVYSNIISVNDMFISNDGKIFLYGSPDNATKQAMVEYNPATNTVVTRATIQGIQYNPTGFAEANGKYYGTTQNGGDNDQGFVIEFDPTANTLTKKVSFEKATFNTTYPQGLMRASSGKLYGLASWGGPTEGGYVFEYNPNDNTYTKLAYFALTSGVSSGKLVEAPNGKMYGTGNSGGAGGIIFEFDPATNTLMDLINLQSAPTRSIVGTLIHSNNKLYGVAAAGGANSTGAIVEFDYNTLVFKNLYDFEGFSEGSNPFGGLALASNGKLYGTTKYGGTQDGGVLYEINPADNQYAKILDFGGSLGMNPIAPLITGTNGKLYGTTNSGGPMQVGTVFEFDPQTKTARVMLNLMSSDNIGLAVKGPMSQATNGVLYAAAAFGGSNTSSPGTLIELNPSTKIANRLKVFNTADGLNPGNGLIVASNGKVYGTIKDGGTNNLGVLFEYNITTSTYAVKYNFESSAPNPNSPLVEVNGKLYGTVPSGGAQNLGVLFEYDIQNNVFTKKHEFTIGQGGGKLLLASNGKLYGISRYGSAGNAVFEYDITTNTVTKKSSLPTANSFLDEMVPLLVQTTKSIRLDQSVVISPITGKVLGQAAFKPTVTASSGLPVTLTAGNDKISVDATNTVTMLKGGQAILKGNQAGNSAYTAAAEAQLSFCVNPPKPVITASNGGTSTMQLSSSNSSGNQWYKDGQLIQAQVASILNITDPGVYTVVTSVEGCSSEVSAPFIVVVTGDADLNNETIAIYPNPVQERLYINLPGTNQKRVTLMQTDGRIAEEHQTSERVLEIDVRNYSAGLYLVRIVDETGTHPTVKFIKK